MTTYTQIVSYPIYEISNTGDVRRIDNKRTVKSWLNEKHQMVWLLKSGVRKCVYVHRLVLLTYGPAQPADKPLALHLDDFPTHNCILNLTWGDKRDNAQMAISNGRLCPSSLKVWLSPSEAAQVRDEYSAGKSMRTIAKQYGCSRWTISNIVRNRVARLRAAA